MQPNEATLIIVDGNHALHRVLRMEDYAGLSSTSGEPTGGVYGVLSTLRKSLQKFNVITNIIYCWDSESRSARRMALLPEYKANRGPKPGEEEEHAKFKALFDDQRLKVMEILVYLGCRQIILPGKEGDDLVGRICTHYKDTPKVIVSEDRDFLQLIDDTTSMYRPILDKFFTKENFKEAVGVPLCNFKMKKALLGDDGDAVPGIEGVGGTTTDKVANAMSEVAGPETFDSRKSDLIRACNDLMESDKRSRKRYSKIVENLDIVDRNFKLIDICAEEFTQEEQNTLDREVHSRAYFLEQEILQFFQRMEFNSFLQKWSWFSEPFRRLS
jgi:5'-3' exonuclease